MMNLLILVLVGLCVVMVIQSMVLIRWMTTIQRWQSAQDNAICQLISDIQSQKKKLSVVPPEPPPPKEC